MVRLGGLPGMPAEPDRFFAALAEKRSISSKHKLCHESPDRDTPEKPRPVVFNRTTAMDGDRRPVLRDQYDA
jgi:hypothetical protein